MRFKNELSFRMPVVAVVAKPQTSIPVPVAEGGIKLRDRFPFLNDPDCPIELQALVTRRISDYHQYQQLYQQLPECRDETQSADIAGKLLKAYLDNQAIFKELDYYQKNHKILGHHHFFQHFNDLNRLRSMNVRNLIKEEQKTRDNIWRVKSEMRKGDKPHLEGKRREKLQLYEQRLAEINRLLGE